MPVSIIGECDSRNREGRETKLKRSLKGLDEGD